METKLSSPEQARLQLDVTARNIKVQSFLLNPGDVRFIFVIFDKG